LQPERLYVVAGRPGQGKTSWLISIARHQILQLGQRVAIFSLEMSAKQLMRRFPDIAASKNGETLYFWRFPGWQNWPG